MEEVKDFPEEVMGNGAKGIGKVKECDIEVSFPSLLLGPCVRPYWYSPENPGMPAFYTDVSTHPVFSR